MKRRDFFLLLLVFLLCTICKAQSSNFILQSPPFTSANLKDVITFGDNNILSFGDGGKMIKSTDGGNSWSIVTSPTSDNINDAFFIDQNTGWIVADSRIFKTTDGGSTWNEQNDGTSATLYGIDFISPTTGWIAGTSRTILKTTDGGSNWVSQLSSQSLVFLYDIDFVDQNYGYAVGWGSEGQLYKTSDGGINWTPVSLTGTWLNKVFFHDQMNGYAVGCHSTYISVTSDPFMGTSITVNSPKLQVWKTTNGGVDWTSIYWESSGYLRGINFKDNLNGFFVGDGGAVIKTSDGAQSFSFITNPAIPQITYNDIAYTNSSHILVAGNFGYILKSTDQGSSWSVKNGNGTTNNINDSFFLNQNLGYASCDNGVVLKTTNGGSTWLAQTAGGTQYDDWYSIYFTDDLKGWIVGQTGRMRYTTNGGTTWTYKYLSNSWTLNELWLKDQNSGFAVGEYGTIMKTDDGGNSWSKVTLSTTNTLYGIHFIDSNNGWICGTGIVIKTTDGGITWNENPLSNPYQYKMFYSLYFMNSSTGWIAGKDGTILKTTDGGTNWTLIDFPSTSDINKIYFIDANNGFALTSDGAIIKTTDGGNKWGSVNNDYVPSWGGFSTIKFFDLNNGFIMGKNGYILKTSNGGGPVYYSPVLQSPANATLNVSLTPTLTWEAVQGAASYELLISEYYTYQGAQPVTVYQTNYNPSSLLPDKWYNWKVRSVYPDGKSLYSKSIQFKTQGAAQTYSLNISAVNGTVTKNPDQTNYPEGTQVVLTAIPNTGYHFNNWSGDVFSLSNPLTITMDGNKNITADFYANTYKLTVNAVNGTVRVQPLLPEYEYGSSVKITATPFYGYQFTGWSGDASGTDNPLTIVIDRDLNILAEFSKITCNVTLTANPPNGGTVTGAGIYDYASSVVITASPSLTEGNKFKFINWTENSVEVSKNQSFTFTALADRNFVANFENITSVNEYGLPDHYSLKQNYPNPFNPVTIIEFGIPQESFVKLSVFNAIGEELLVLIEETLSPAFYSVPFNAGNLPNGIYFYKIQSGNYVQTKKMILLK